MVLNQLLINLEIYGLQQIFVIILIMKRTFNNKGKVVKDIWVMVRKIIL